ERIRGLAAQPSEVEFGDQPARRPVPELERARDEALREVLVDEAELGEDLERRRLRGRSAGAVVDSLLRFEQRDAVTEARAGQRSDRADRSRADHQDVAPLHFERRLY